MAPKSEPDFGGYVTKTGLRCSDGRTIKPEAFQHMDGKKVPLVWQHGHSNPENVLGHTILEVRHDGVYGYSYFNSTPNGQHINTAVKHDDIDSMSIYATGIKEVNKNVSHGNIKEVSLVLSGANPGAKIDYIRIQHSEDADDYTELDNEAIISHAGVDGFQIDLASDGDEEQTSEENVEHADSQDMTVQDIVDSMTEDQRNVMAYFVGEALQEGASSGGNSTTSTGDTAAHSENDENKGEEVAHQEGTDMSRNVFEQNAGGAQEEKALSHDELKAATASIFADAPKRGSLKEAVKEYAIAHGINTVDVLFPEAKTVGDMPQVDARRVEWVAKVMAAVKKTPFSRIKTFVADLNQDDARAKGYIKGNYKLEEWFGVTKRVTSPTTVYKKQKLDRDDILDITDFDAVAFLKSEMDMMLREEIARAILIGDGRGVSDEDKIKDPLGASDGTGIRSIISDHELFVTQVQVNVDDANSNYDEVIDTVLDAMEFYKGTGGPTFYTTIRELNKFKKAKDAQGRRLYANNQEVADALGVSEIVTVEAMNNAVDSNGRRLIGIIVNLADYNVGTDQGGEINMFDFFDIDYNQQKYLLETRMSGALVRPKAALVITAAVSTNTLAAPTKPAFNATTGVVTIPTVTGVVYKGSDGTTTLSAGAQTALSAGASTTVYAVPASGYFFATNRDDSWSFTRLPA